MPSSPPPSIRELAAQLGISRTTVSLALRRHPSVASKTRDRVLAAAKKAGYQSNALVNALMTQVRGRKRLNPTGEVITYLTAFENQEHWKTMPSIVAQYEGAKVRASELGFDLQHMWMGNLGMHSRRISHTLRSRGIRASLLAPLPMDHDTLALNWNDHTVVAIGYSFQQVALHRVVHHNINAMFACYASLRRFGYKRIGLTIHRLDDSRVNHLWQCGFLGAQRIYGGDRLEPLIFDDYVDPSPFVKWLRASKPDALIGIWRHVTLDWLQELGINVPEDMGFASLDPGTEYEGRIAGIHQDNHSVGMAAVDVLAGQLFRNEIGIPSAPKITMVEGTWMDGPTVTRRT
ncbi:MAG: LacI family DNA-binding transcriptional regulator [Opitutaceae bacterium]|jgi:DNA-binding LacI/PurR family transcriptional regulator